jgi:hypothetical protein
LHIFWRRNRDAWTWKWELFIADSLMDILNMRNSAEVSYRYLRTGIEMRVFGGIGHYVSFGHLHQGWWQSALSNGNIGNWKRQTIGLNSFELQSSAIENKYQILMWSDLFVSRKVTHAR